MTMPKCPSCGNATDNIVAVEYGYPHPQHYDGISEYRCPCGTRWGRWSGRILTGDEFEYRFGQQPTTERKAA